MEVFRGLSNIAERLENLASQQANCKFGRRWRPLGMDICRKIQKNYKFNTPITKAYGKFTNKVKKN